MPVIGKILTMIVIYFYSATITIKCEMDFVLYPLDVQNCAIDFSSCKYILLC